VKDFLNYEQMAARHVEAAYRNLVREVLAHVATEGLPGTHHFYVTFRTSFSGVIIPDNLRREYPEEMTIVLEHQFWDLEVKDNEFSVTLKFRNRPERLTVPFEAVSTFVDPSVKFGVEFQSMTAAEPAAATAPEALPPPVEQKPDEKADKSGQVVTLDAFRKK
jgi:hypothetical protein